MLEKSNTSWRVLVVFGGTELTALLHVDFLFILDFVILAFSCLLSSA